MTRPRQHPEDRRPANSPAVVLLSGGLDSATVLAIARRAGHACHCLTFDYGQRHRFELVAATRVAEHLGAASHRTLTIDLRPQGGSALTSSIPVPKDRADLSEGIPVTYVPARNLIFLSMAIAWCEVLHARHLYIGVNAVDFSGYPDCRPQFIEAFQHAANLATRAGVEGEAPVRIETPIIDLGKADIIRRGLDLGVDFALTHSCYDPDPRGLACAHCDACILRRRGFEQAGAPDPTPYAIGAARHA